MKTKFMLFEKNRKIITYLLLTLLIILPLAHTAALQSFLYISAFLLWLIRMSKEKKYELNFKGLFPVILLFFVSIIISIFYSIDYASTIAEIKGEFLTYILIYLLIVNNLKTEDVKKFLFFLLITGTLIGIYGILEYFLFKKPPFPRADSFMSDYNFLSGYLTMLLPIVLFFISLEKDKLKKLCFLLSFITIIWCLMLTYSRGAWVAALVVIFIFASFKGKKFLLSFTLIIILLSLIAPKKLVEREKTLIEIKKYSQEATISSRLALWSFGLQEIKKSPLIGHGYGKETFKKKYPKLSKNQPNWHTHNLFIDITLELGLTGLACFLLLFFTILKKLYGNIKNSTSQEEKMVLFILFLCIIGFLTRCFFDYLYIDNLARILWFLIGLGMLFNKSSLAVGQR